MNYFYNIIKTKDFITFEHMGKFLSYTLSYKDYMERLSQSKFVICPPGKGKDTFRFYDTIYSGAIPIVIREKFPVSYTHLTLPTKRIV